MKFTQTTHHGLKTPRTWFLASVITVFLASGCSFLTAPAGQMGQEPETKEEIASECPDDLKVPCKMGKDGRLRRY